MGNIKVIHLFSGVGAPEMALKRLGLPVEFVGFSEIDKYAIQSYRAIHGNDIPNLGSVTDIERLPQCNLLIYGFPCQSISISGLQEGFIDKEGNQTRSGLLFEVEQLLEVAKDNNELPNVLLMENVKNLVSKKFKPDFDRWLNKLEELGYINYWQVLNAKDYEIPQNRERVFVVSILKGEDEGYKFPDKMPLVKRLKDVLEDKVDEKFYIDSSKFNNFLKFGNTNPSGRGMNGNVCTKDICNTLTTNKGERLKILVTDKVIQVGNIVNTGNWNNPQRGCIYSADGISPTLNCMQGGGLEPKIIDDTYANREPREYTKTCPTIRAERSGFKVVDNLRIRKLTPKECWRLMGFDDADFDKAQASGVSNSQLYKQAGNSIVVNVLYHIFRELYL